METVVRRALGERRAIDQMERDLWNRLLQIGQMLLQDNANLQGSGDLGTTPEYEGRTLDRPGGMQDGAILTSGPPARFIRA